VGSGKLIIIISSLRMSAAWRPYKIQHFLSTGKESVPKIIINGTINYFFFNCSQHLGNFKPWQFRVLFDKIASVLFCRIYSQFRIGNGQPTRKPALCQLYRHTFVPHHLCFRVKAETHVCVECGSDFSQRRVGVTLAEVDLVGDVYLHTATRICGGLAAS